MTDDSQRFTAVANVLNATDDARLQSVASALLARGYLPLHEGKTFHQYTDRWEDRPRYLVGIDKLRDKPSWLAAARYYRLAFRNIASSTNERTAIFALIPPGFVFGNSAASERAPHQRYDGDALLLAAVANSFPFDWSLRQKNAANVSLFILNGCPVPSPDTLAEPLRRMLVHSALRLTANHEGYAALWSDQLGDAWREGDQAPRTWPVLEGDTARWIVRAAIDAVVADAYGLSREQFAHVLGSFSHRSYPSAPELCLAAFDGLHRLGLEAFIRKHDPYWDIPLTNALPQPVIDLGVEGLLEPVDEVHGQGQGSLFGDDESAGANDTDTHGEDDADTEAEA